LAKDQKRLGRGLSSLVAPDLMREEMAIPPSPATTVPMDRVRGLQAVNRLMMIAVGSVRNNPTQPRKAFDEVGLAALADSIRDRGALQPIVVRPAEGGYELVAGERRLRAARMAGLAELPAIVRATRDEEMLELALVENVQRADLNAVERGRAYRVLHEEHGLSHEEIGRRMGEDRATVSNYIRLLALPAEILDMVAAGTVDMGHARAILACKDIQVQLSLVSRVVGEGWSVRRLEKEIAQMGAASAVRPRERQVRPAVKDLEDRLSAGIGARVHIREGRRRHSGKIIIEYGSLDEFQRIAAALGVGDDGA
jgi:ParB family transcriptional regulator, chromosome partitioning protein